MESKLDGAGVRHAARVSAPQLRVLIAEPESAPAPVSISYTNTAHARAASLRLDRIAVIAYYLSKVRGLELGHEADDWLRAQAQVEAKDACTVEN